jgi:hypothetical protein
MLISILSQPGGKKKFFVYLLPPAARFLKKAGQKLLLALRAKVN